MKAAALNFGSEQCVRRRLQTVSSRAMLCPRRQPSHASERSTIVAYAFAFPIPAGQTEAVRRFIEECLGRRRAEFDDMMRRSDLTEESYWLQRDPERGDQLVVFGREDLAAFLAIMANPRTEFDRWYREQIMTIFGEDPTADSGPPNELLGTWKA